MEEDKKTLEPISLSFREIVILSHKLKKFSVGIKFIRKALNLSEIIELDTRVYRTYGAAHAEWAGSAPGSKPEKIALRAMIKFAAMAEKNKVEQALIEAYDYALTGDKNAQMLIIRALAEHLFCKKITNP